MISKCPTCGYTGESYQSPEEHLDFAHDKLAELGLAFSRLKEALDDIERTIKVLTRPEVRK